MKTFRWTFPDKGIGKSPEEYKEYESKKYEKKWAKSLSRGKRIYVFRTTILFIFASGSVSYLFGYKREIQEIIVTGSIAGLWFSLYMWNYMKTNFQKHTSETAETKKET